VNNSKNVDTTVIDAGINTQSTALVSKRKYVEDEDIGHVMTDINKLTNINVSSGQSKNSTGNYILSGNNSKKRNKKSGEIRSSSKFGDDSSSTVNNNNDDLLIRNMFNCDSAFMSSLNVVSDDNAISPNNHTLNNSNIINDNLIKPEELISEDLLDIFKVSECENSPYTLKREKISTHKRSVKVEKVCPVVFDDIDEIFKNIL
jgi:hypothetical protein